MNREPAKLGEPETEAFWVEFLRDLSRLHKQAFVRARKAGRLEKVRDDEENTGHFRLT